MDVTIVSRNERARRGHQLLAVELALRLPRFFKDISFVEWSLQDDRVEKVVHCRLHAGRTFFRISTAAETFAHAMHLAIEKLIEQRRREKHRRVRGRRTERELASA